MGPFNEEFSRGGEVSEHERLGGCSIGRGRKLGPQYRQVQRTSSEPAIRTQGRPAERALRLVPQGRGRGRMSLD